MWEGLGFGGNKPISCDLILKGCRSLGMGRGRLEEVGEPVRVLSNAAVDLGLPEVYRRPKF